MITAIENIRFEKYFRFIEFKHTESFTSHRGYLLNTRVGSRKILILLISKLLVYCCHSDIDYIKNCILTNFNS